MKAEIPSLLEQLEDAWALIANASNGDWDKEGGAWKAAATKWRDNWFKIRARAGMEPSTSAGRLHNLPSGGLLSGGWADRCDRLEGQVQGLEAAIRDTRDFVVRAIVEYDSYIAGDRDRAIKAKIEARLRALR